ncbi:hypothetical protein NDU88_006207 [Pleurodeles waltl]|uniref:Uncharacterized protein n=1 Tax=Pleurodeles waltl TaxID=8319 RepID=A0AAV7SNU5_PLEWA|nr:hypothetical protein NDU88_006207 [Pleurodeles waltl]
MSRVPASPQSQLLRWVLYQWKGLGSHPSAAYSWSFARLFAAPAILARSPEERAALAPQVLAECTAGPSHCSQGRRSIAFFPTGVPQSPSFPLPLVQGSKWRSTGPFAPPPTLPWVAARIRPSSQVLTSASPYRPLSQLSQSRHGRQLSSPCASPSSLCQGRVVSQSSTRASGSIVASLRSRHFVLLLRFSARAVGPFRAN